MTDRERQVARAVALGSTVDEVAAQLCVHPGSVRRHLASIYRKYGLRSQAELVGWAVAHGMVTVPELQRVYCGGEVGPGTER